MRFHEVAPSQSSARAGRFCLLLAGLPFPETAACFVVSSSEPFVLRAPCRSHPCHVKSERRGRRAFARRADVLPADSDAFAPSVRESLQSVALATSGRDSLGSRGGRPRFVPQVRGAALPRQRGVWAASGSVRAEIAGSEPSPGQMWPACGPPAAAAGMRRDAADGIEYHKPSAHVAASAGALPSAP